jgi:hypothetical protein
MRLMRSRCVGRVYLLATMVALANLNPLSLRIAVAQLDEGGADVGEDGEAAVLEGEGGFVGEDGDAAALGAEPWRRKPKSGQPAPDKALQTIDEFQRAKERASGTPEPEPTPLGGWVGKE